MMKHKNNTSTTKFNVLGKVFKIRESLLTELSRSPHFIIVKNIFYVSLLGFIVRDAVFSFVLNQKVTYGLNAILHGFVKFPTMLMLWCLFFVLNLLTYFSFNLWCSLRMKFNVTHSLFLNWKVKLLDWTFLLLFLSYIIGVLYLLPLVTKSITFGLATVTALCMDQIRLLMKSYAFIRANVSNVLSYKQHSDQNLFRPTFKHYLYFSFAPTLVYRHEYPRTKSIDWWFVIKCFFDVFVFIWIVSYIFETFILYRVYNIDISKNFWSQVLQVIMDGIPASFILLITLFYILLHCWQNAFAEMLRFGDRQFYTDWWTITNFRMYIRKWNIIVADWLYEYVYKDVSENITPNSKSVPRVMVFVISSIFHEYIIIVVTQHFFPFMFAIFFTLGVAFTYVNTKHPIFNILFLYAIGIVCATTLTFYAVEIVVNENCLINETGVMDYLIPSIFRKECVNYI